MWRRTWPFVACWHINTCLPLGLYWACLLQKHNTGDFYWRVFFFFPDTLFPNMKVLNSGFDQLQSSCFQFSLWFVGGKTSVLPLKFPQQPQPGLPPLSAPPAPPSLHASGPFHLAFLLLCPWQRHLGLWKWKLILKSPSHRLLGPGCGEFPASSLQTESSLSGQLPQWVQKTVSPVTCSDFLFS